jgi:hypothetical protein
MPHFTQASIDTQSISSLDRSLTALSLQQTLSPARLAAANNHEVKPIASQTLVAPSLCGTEGGDNWKRSSLAIVDAYATLIVGGNNMIHEMPERNSVNYGDNTESKRRSQYYEDVHEYKANGNSSAQERVYSESPVVAELRTNVIVCSAVVL